MVESFKMFYLGPFFKNIYLKNVTFEQRYGERGFPLQINLWQIKSGKRTGQSVSSTPSDQQTWNIATDMMSANMHPWADSGKDPWKRCEKREHNYFNLTPTAAILVWMTFKSNLDLAVTQHTEPFAWKYY